MNKQRRKSIYTVTARIDQLYRTLFDIKDQLTKVQEEEIDSFENRSEGSQATESGQQSEEAIETMEEAISHLKEAMDLLDDLI